MNDVNDLRLRVAAAEEHFKQIDERQHTYGARLLGLMNAVESGLSRKQSALEHCTAELERVTAENQQLREMLHNLLQVIEAKDEDRLDQSMLSLDAMVSALNAKDLEPSGDETVIEQLGPSETDGAVPAAKPDPESASESAAESATDTTVEAPGAGIRPALEAPDTASDVTFEPETADTEEADLQDEPSSTFRSPVGEIIDRISQRMNYPSEEVVMASLAKIEAGVTAAQADAHPAADTEPLPEPESGLETEAEDTMIRTAAAS